MKDDQPTLLELEEYRALRDVIGRRGSLRTVLVVATVAAWALAAALVAALLALPLASLLPLLILLAGAEAVHSLHIGAERIGRYLYVRYESGTGAGNAAPGNSATPMWETAIAAFEPGRLPYGSRPSGPHFAALFTMAVLANLSTGSLGATPTELAALAAIHGLVIVRIVMARAASKNQRRDDQAEFERILR